MSRKLNILTTISGVGCIIVLVISWVTSNLDVRKHRVKITQDFHVTFFRGGMWFYSASLPYMGSITGVINSGFDPKIISNGWSTGDYGFVRETYTYRTGTIQNCNACDLPGVYYRHFEEAGTGEPPSSTLMISLWYPFLIFAILPIVWFFKRREQFAKSPFWKFFER